MLKKSTYFCAAAAWVLLAGCSETTPPQEKTLNIRINAENGDIVSDNLTQIFDFKGK